MTVVLKEYMYQQNYKLQESKTFLILYRKSVLFILFICLYVTKLYTDTCIGVIQPNHGTSQQVVYENRSGKIFS